MTAAILRAGARTFLSVRKHRNYRLFFTGQVISNIGTWMQRVAQAWLILSLTHSPVAVGILALCQFLPFTLFSLVAGVGVELSPSIKAFRRLPFPPFDVPIEKRQVGPLAVAVGRLVNPEISPPVIRLV